MSKQSKLSTSVLTSSESYRDPAVAVASSVHASSDLAGDIDNLSLEPCNVCQKKSSSKVNEASWYCTDCSDYLCEGCKADHKKFKLLRIHTIISSMEKTKMGSKVSTAGPLQSSIVQQPVHNVSNPATNELQMGTNTQTDKATGKEPTIVRPYSRRKAKYVTTFDAKIAADTEPSIISSAFLPDGRLLLVDCDNSKLQLFDGSFCFVTSKPFKITSTPWCVSVFDSSEVAVLTRDMTITRLSVQGDIEVTGTIRLKFYSWAVDYISRDILAVTSVGVYPNFLCVYSTSGIELARISTDTAGNKLFGNPANVKVDRQRSRAYVSDFGSNTVLALDLSDNNKLIFTYKHAELARPQDITVDKEGNIYVCGCYTYNIHQISPRGEHIQILLSENDGLKYPRTMCFSPSGDTYVVGSSRSGDGKTVQVFKME